MLAQGEVGVGCGQGIVHYLNQSSCWKHNSFYLQRYILGMCLWKNIQQNSINHKQLKQCKKRI